MNLGGSHSENRLLIKKGAVPIAVTMKRFIACSNDMHRVLVETSHEPVDLPE